MFEYLMPLLVMPTYENTLLDRLTGELLKDKFNTGKRGVPWGISSHATMQLMLVSTISTVRLCPRSRFQAWTR